MLKISLPEWSAKHGNPSLFIRVNGFKTKLRPFSKLSRQRQYKLAMRMEGYLKDEYGAIFVGEDAEDPRGKSKAP